MSEVVEHRDAQLDQTLVADVARVNDRTMADRRETADTHAVIIGGRLPDPMNHALAVEIDRPDFLITTDMDRFLPRPRVLGGWLASASAACVRPAAATRTARSRARRVGCSG